MSVEYSGTGAVWGLESVYEAAMVTERTGWLRTNGGYKYQEEDGSIASVFVGL